MQGVPIDSAQLALRSARLFETKDLDEARERISGIMQPHDLAYDGRGAGRHAHMDFVRLRGLGIGTISFGSALIDVPPLDNYHLFVFCLSGAARLQVAGIESEVDRFKGVTCGPGQALRGRFSADCEQFVLRIDQQRLAEFNGRGDIALAPYFDLRSARAQPWLAVLRALVTDHATLTLSQRDARVAADYEQLLLRLLLNGQALTPDMPPMGRVRPGFVRRAMAFIEAHAAQPLTLGDIAAAAGVAERTLHQSFRHFTGVSPMRYLRDRRLDQARALLLAASPGASVTAAALGAGFSHLGRFAQDYATRFGETPSVTLRRR
jgi:AraC-like DNA-binding protein